MRSIERLNGPDIISWPECTLDEPGMDAPGGLLICMGWDFRILPAESDGWPACAASIFMLSAEGLDIALCELSECEGIWVVAGFVEGGVFLVVETGFFAGACFFALAFVAVRGLDALFFFAGAFEAFAFGVTAGFFFVVSLAPGILCPSC